MQAQLRQCWLAYRDLPSEHNRDQAGAAGASADGDAGLINRAEDRYNASTAEDDTPLPGGLRASFLLGRAYFLIAFQAHQAITLNHPWQQRLPISRTVSLDVNTTDLYGRSAAEVISDININLALVEGGQAFANRQYLGDRDAKEYLDAEYRAIRRRYGCGM